MLKDTNQSPKGYTGSHRKRPAVYFGKHERREGLSSRAAVYILGTTILAGLAASVPLGASAGAGKVEKAKEYGDAPFEQCHIAEILPTDKRGLITLPLAVVPRPGAADQLLRQKVTVATHTTNDTSGEAPQTVAKFRSNQVAGMDFRQPDIILRPPKELHDGMQISFVLNGGDTWQVPCADQLSYDHRTGWTRLPVPEL